MKGSNRESAMEQETYTETTRILFDIIFIPHLLPFSKKTMVLLIADPGYLSLIASLIRSNCIMTANS